VWPADSTPRRPRLPSPASQFLGDRRVCRREGGGQRRRRSPPSSSLLRPRARRLPRRRPPTGSGGATPPLRMTEKLKPLPFSLQNAIPNESRLCENGASEHRSEQRSNNGRRHRQGLSAGPQRQPGWQTAVACRSTWQTWSRRRRSSERRFFASPRASRTRPNQLEARGRAPLGAHLLARYPIRCRDVRVRHGLIAGEGSRPKLQPPRVSTQARRSTRSVPGS
jgi:hypothetical protein